MQESLWRYWTVMSKKAVIVSGGTLEEIFVSEILGNMDYEILIGVDRGNAFLYEHGICPTHVVGDFDSLSEDIVQYYKGIKEIEVREFDPVKDASDTEIAVRLAIELSCTSIIILGATGTRIDHIWANVQVLHVAKEEGAQAILLDSHNRIRLIEEETHLKKSEAFGPYFSVFPLGGEVKNFGIRGAKYPLYDHLLTPYDSLCVSNQIEGEEAVITFPEGKVILMETRD